MGYMNETYMGYMNETYVGYMNETYMGYMNSQVTISWIVNWNYGR